MSNKVSVTVQTEQSKNFELDSRFKGQQNFDDGREQSFEACLLEKYIVFLKAKTSPDLFLLPKFSVLHYARKNSGISSLEVSKRQGKPTPSDIPSDFCPEAEG